MKYHSLVGVVLMSCVLSGCGEEGTIEKGYLHYGAVDTREPLQANLDRLSGVEKLEETAPSGIGESLTGGLDFKPTGQYFYIGYDPSNNLGFEISESGGKIYKVTIYKQKSAADDNLSLEQIEKHFGISSDTRSKTISRHAGGQLRSYYECKDGEVEIDTCAISVFTDRSNDSSFNSYSIRWTDLTFEVRN